MKLCRKAFFVIFIAVLSSCSLDENDQAPLLIFSKDFDFSQGEQGWEHGFADYPAGPDDSILFDLRYAYTDDVPESLLTKRSLMLSGKNLNKDLFMYLKKKVDQLKPNTDYTITFTVELASNLNSPLSAGGSVYLKAGATHIEPKSVIDAGNYVLNIDKGNGGIAGEDAITLGDIATPANSASYAVVTRNNTMTNSRHIAKTNSDGELWLIVGTDSSLEGCNTVFYTRVNVVLSAS